MANVKIVVNDFGVFEAEGVVVMLNNASKLEIDGEEKEIKGENNCVTFAHGYFDTTDRLDIVEDGVKKMVETFAEGDDVKKLLFCIALQSVARGLIDETKGKMDGESQQSESNQG